MRGLGSQNELLFALGMIGYIIILVILVSLFFIPMIQNFVESGRRKWFTKNIKKQISSNLISAEGGQLLLNDVEQKREHTLYKYTKLYLGLFSISFFFTGILFFIASFMDQGVDSINTMTNVLYFSPLVYGVTFFLIFLFVAPKNKLFREIGTFSLFLGCCVFIFGLTSKFEITFIRGEILIFSVLSIGLLLIYKYKAILVSYLYAIIITVAGVLNLVAAVIQDEAVRLPHFYGSRTFNTTLYFDLYDGLLSYFYWIFAAALLYLWNKRFKEMDDITSKEVLFGIFVFLMIMSLSMFVTGQYWIIGGAIGFSLSFIYSSYYFDKSNWFLSKPIHFVLLLIIHLSSVFGNSSVLRPVSENVIWFGFKNISSWLGIFALLALIAIGGTFVWYKFILAKRKINYVFLSFPLVLILGLVLGTYGGSYFFALYLMVFGAHYMWCGISNKNEPYIFIGTMFLIQGFSLKIAELFTPGAMNFIQPYMQSDISTQDYYSNIIFNYAILFLILGFAYAGIVFFLRQKWQVTGDFITNGNNNTNNPAVLDEHYNIDTGLNESGEDIILD